MAIEVLSSDVVDQISAGEVVERPAHLVKELVENSLDAGATELEVEIDQGGKQVLVRDNGNGMDPEDLVLSVSRHATSKIQSANDIWSLSTFGFRGEALASIAAVSELSLVSRRKKAQLAHELKSRFGKLDPLVSVGGAVGTTVVVRNLFANTPVRLKFLKSDVAETTQIKQVLKAMALSSPQVDFRLRVGGKLIHFWPATESLKSRAEQVLDRQPLYFAEGIEKAVEVKVAFCAPHQVANSSRQIWMFVRGRWVVDRGLMAAVMESYRNLLMQGEYPVVVLWVDLHPDWVDVNIHPTKSQVKFRDSSLVFRAIRQVLRANLEKAPWLSQILKDKEVSQSYSEFDKRDKQDKMNKLNTSDQDENKAIASALSQNFDSSPKTEVFTSNFASEEFQRTQYPVKPNWEIPSSSSASVTQVKNPQSSHVADWSLPSLGYSSNEAEQNRALDHSRWNELQIIGQAHLTYILAQSQKSLILIDQHAAHERVAFETLIQAWKGGNIEAQRFLLPLTINLDSDFLEAIVGRKSDLEELGVTIEPSGSECLLVHACPSLLKESGVEKAIRKLGQDIVEKGESFAFEEVVGELFC